MNYWYFMDYLGFPRWLSRKVSTCQYRRHRRRGFETWLQKIPWRRKWESTPIFLLGESHGQRSLGGLHRGLHRAGHDWACMHLWVTSDFSPSSIMLQWASLYIHLRGFLGLFCALYYFRISSSRKSLFKILLGISKLSSSWFYQTPLPQAVQYSFPSCFPSIPGLYNSQTLNEVFLL